MGFSYTAAISPEPVVVIVDDQSILAVWLEEFFLESGLAVCRVELNALAVTLEDLDRKSHQIYKIVFLYGFTAHSEWLKDIVHKTGALSQQHLLVLGALDLLQNRTESVVAIVHQTSLDLAGFSSSILADLQQINTFEKEVLQRVSQQQGAQVFVGVDTLDYSDGIELPLLYSFLGAQQNVLFDPESNWYIQPIDAVYLTVANQLLKPHRAQTVVIHGKKRLANFWLEKIAHIYTQYFQTALALVHMAAETNPLTGFAESVLCQTQESVEEVLDSKVRALPSLLKTLQEINEQLIAADKDPLNLSVQDLITKAQRSSLQTGMNLPSKWQKTPSSIGSGETVQAKITKAGNTSVEVLKNNKTLINGSNNESKSSDNDRGLVIEEWNEKITIATTAAPVESVPLAPPAEKGVVYLDQELQKIFSTSRFTQKKQRSTQKVKTTKKLIFKSKRHKLLFSSGLSLVGVGCLIVVLMGVYQLSVTEARKTVFASITQVMDGKSLPSTTNSWVQLLHTQVGQYAKIVKQDMVEGGKVLTEIADSTASLNQTNQNLEKNTQQWLRGLQGVEEYDVGAVSQQTAELLGKEHEKLTSLSDLFKKIDIADLSSGQQKTLEQSAVLAEKNSSDAVEVARFLQAAPEMFGAKEKKTYAVLVQNDLELRPTGGFLQSVLLLTWNRGVLVDSKVYSTYEIDNKLASVVKPPDEIKKVLGEQRWYLRDSNWNSNFPDTAKQVNWFIEESLGRSVDGVIALNYSTIRDLLKVVGPVSLDDFNEEITDKNIYDKLEFHAQSKIDTKTGQKIEYPAAVLTKILEEVKKLNASKASTFFAVFYQGLVHKEISMSSFNTDDAQVLQELGWDGSLINPKCPSQFVEKSCVVDSFYQVDANVGINLVNGYLEKKSEDRISVDRKLIKHQRVITYTNNAKLDLWPQGTYRAYVKFYMPGDSQLQLLTVNSIPINSDALTLYTENGRRVLGTVIEVLKQKTITVNLNYDLPNAFNTPFSYFFFNQKQPGDRGHKEVFVTLGKDLKARVVAPKAVIKEQEMKFTVPEDGDVAVGLTLE